MKRKILISVAVLFSVLLLVVIINGKNIKGFLDPKYQSRLRVESGINFMEKGEVDSAIARLQSAVEMDPQLAEAHYYLGKAYGMKGLPPEAEAAEYEKAVQFRSNFLSAHQDLGSVYVQMNKYPEAEQQFRKVIEIKPNDAAGYSNLGYLYFLQGKGKEAEKNFLKAIELDPTYRHAVHNLSRLYLELGRLKEAQAALEKSLSIEPNNAGAHYYLALIAEKQKDKPAAVEHWRKAIKLGLEGAELKEAQEHLEKLK